MAHSVIKINIFVILSKEEYQTIPLSIVHSQTYN